MLFSFFRLRFFAILISVFMVLLAVGFSSSSLKAETATRLAVIRDEINAYSFGTLSVIPIDSQYIDPSICIFLDSCLADSVVKIFPNADPADTLFTRPSGKTVKLADLSRYYKIYFSADQIWTDFENGYYDRDSLSYVSAAEIYQTENVIPNDPSYVSQWHLHNNVGTDGKTNIELAWEKTKGNANQLIGMIDTGIDGDHPEFAGRLVGGISLGNSPWNTDSEPGEGHGTSVAGLMIANTNNNLGVAGVNWNAGIWVGNLDKFEDPSIARGIDEARLAGVQFINMSLGGSDFDEDVADAAYNAWITGISVVAAKGNGNTSAPNYPSDLDVVIGVGANNQNDDKASFSNIGNGIKVAAPGVTITTVIDGGGVRTNFGGTSAASPIATGVLSLIRAANPDLWADEAEEILYITARDAGAPGYDNDFGYGIVDAKAAVDYALNHDFHRLGGPHTSLVEVQGLHIMEFSRVIPGVNLASGFFNTFRYSAKRWIDYSQYNLIELPDVLFRLRDTDGWGVGAPVNGFPFAQIVPGTQTIDGVMVETFAYHLFTLNGSDAGWWPCPTGNCGTPVTDLQVTVAAPNCCVGMTGNVDNDPNNTVDITDMNMLIDYLFINNTPLPCKGEADVTGDRLVDIVDLTVLIDHLFINFIPLADCP